MSTATDQTLVCTISGLSQNSPVTWIGPNNNEISDSDTNNYVIDQGTYIFGSKASTLSIKTAKFASLSSGDVFKCKLKSSFYPNDSPDVVKEMVLTLLTLGYQSFHLNTIFNSYAIIILFINFGYIVILSLYICYKSVTMQLSI